MTPNCPVLVFQVVPKKNSIGLVYRKVLRPCRPRKVNRAMIATTMTAAQEKKIASARMTRWVVLTGRSGRRYCPVGLPILGLAGGMKPRLFQIGSFWKSALRRYVRNAVWSGFA